MGQIIITKPGGSTVKLGTTNPAVPITRAEQIWSLMEDDKVEIDVESATVLDIGPGDYLTVFGRKYIMNSMPTIDKKGSRYYEYKFVFEGIQYQLAKLQYTLIRSGFTQSPEFTFMGDLATGFLPVMASVLSRLSYTFTMTADNSGGSKNLTFDSENCLEVLNKLADEYELEWVITWTSGSSFTLNMQPRLGNNYTGTDIFSLDRGITTLKRSYVTGKPFFTRLYPLGAAKNLPSNYRDYSQRLLPSGSSNYIENLSAKTAYGLIEATKVWDDIFPTRTGTVSSLGANELTFLDSSMDFDLNATSGGNTLYLIPGTTPKIHFQTGKLAGYEFALTSYTHASKTFVIVATTDERGLTTPNPSNAEFKIAVGDTYKIIDIWLPSIYVTAAEALLSGKATAYLNANCLPFVQYDVELNELWVKNNMHGRAIEDLYAPGDLIHINDTSLGLSADVRIIGLTRDIIRPYAYKFSLGDSQYRKINYKYITKLKGAVNGVKKLRGDDPAIMRFKSWVDGISLNNNMQ